MARLVYFTQNFGAFIEFCEILSCPRSNIGRTIYAHNANVALQFD